MMNEFQTQILRINRQEIYQTLVQDIECLGVMQYAIEHIHAMQRVFVDIRAISLGPDYESNYEPNNDLNPTRNSDLDLDLDLDLDSDSSLSTDSSSLILSDSYLPSE